MPEQGCLVASGAKYSIDAFGVDSETGEVRWERRTSEYPSGPAAGKGSLAVVDSQHETLGLDARNGKILWRFERGGGPGFQPVIGPDGTVYLNSSPRTIEGPAPLWALDPGSGKLRWEAETDGGANTPRVAPDGSIVTATLFTKHPAIYILDPSSGAIRSRIPLAADSWSTDVGPDGTIHVSQRTDRYGRDLIAVDPKTGKSKWRVGEEGLEFERCSFGLPGKVYAYAYRTEGQGGDRRGVESVLFALDERTGKALWAFVYKSPDSPRLFFPPVGTDGTVFVGFQSRELRSRFVYALHGGTGKVKWKKDL